MASAGTSSPSAADTFLYLMRAPVRLSSWLKLTFLRDTAAYSLIGMLTSPKLMAPLQMALGIRGSIPVSDEVAKGTPVRRLARGVLIGAVVAGLAGACAGGEDDDAGPSDDGEAVAVDLDEIQVLAAHNAYHLEGE